MLPTRPLTLRSPEVRELIATGRCEVRRKMKPQPLDKPYVGCVPCSGDICGDGFHFILPDGRCAWHISCPLPAVGETVWIRETWMPVHWGSCEPVTGKAWYGVGYKPCVYYAADPINGHGEIWDDNKSFWRSPAVMPSWASRLTATVTSLTAEQREGWEWVCVVERKDK